MKVLIALCFEPGDPLGEVTLSFADGSVIGLDHEHAQTHLGIEAFQLPLAGGDDDKENDQ
jgi:hypothetical protein